MTPKSKIVLATVFCCAAFAASPVSATIIDEWDQVKAPPPPKLEQVTVDPKTTALLVLDFVKQTCNDQVRPRCVASLPQVAKLIKGARASKTSVIYSIIVTPATAADILPEVKPEGREPVVAAHADKFIGTRLESILKRRHIETVIVVGTDANGAVLYTASHAAMLGFNVVVPVDGMSSKTPYGEQYVAWNFANSPGTAAKTKLTTIDMVKY